MPFSSIKGRGNWHRGAGTLCLKLIPVWVVVASRLAGAGAVFGQESGSQAGARSAAARPRSDALKFASGLLRQRKFDLAAEEYQRFLDAGAKGAERYDAQFGLGTALLSVGRHRDARAAFDAFLKEAPKDSRAMSARYRLGELSYLLGDLPAARAALELFTNATTDHPSLELAWTYLGDTCFGLEDMPRARMAYERSIAAYPQGRTADRARYGLARTHAASGERDKAVAILEALVKKGIPDWVDRCWLQIGLIQESAGRLSEAVDAFRAVERAAPESALGPEARLHQAVVLGRLKRTGEAEGLLQPLANKGSEAIAPRAALELATIQLENQHPDAALATVEAALKRNPKGASAAALQFRSAEALQKLKRASEAENRFLAMAEGFPDDPWADDATLRAAHSAFDRGDFRAAERLAGRFPARFGRSALRSEARLIEARAAASAGRPKDAVAILETLVAPAPEGAKPGVASKAVAKAAAPALSPELARGARYDLAVAYRAMGRSKEADAVLAELAKGEAGPITADAQFLVGQAHVDAGRNAEAVGPLKAYLAANPHGDVAEFAMAHLVTAQVGMGELPGAWEMLARLGKEFPGSKSLPPARLRVAEAALVAHQADRAAEQFRLMVGSVKQGNGAAPKNDAKPSDAVAPALEVRAYRGLGRALAELGKASEAATAFDAAVALQPGDAGLLAELGWSLVDAEKPAEADRVFERLLKEHPDSPFAADARFNLAESANLRKKYAEVIRLLSPLVAAGAAEGKSAEGTPGTTSKTKAGSDLQSDSLRRLLPAVLYRLGRTQAELKDWAPAIVTLDRLLTEFPKSVYRREARYLRAESALQTGDAAGALAGFSALLREPAEPTDPKGWARAIALKQIQSWIAAKQWKEALEGAAAMKSKLVGGDPALAELDFASGQALAGLARLDEARAAFERVIDASGKGDLGARALLMRGEAYFHQDKLHEALRDFLKVDILYEAPRWQAAALLEAGKVYERLDQWADAAETYGRLLARFPKEAPASQATRRQAAAGSRAAVNRSTRKS